MSEGEHKSRYELFLEEEARTAQPTKRCPKCKQIKDVRTEYTKNKRNKDGIDTYCRTCKSNKKYRNREDRFWKWYHSKTTVVGGCLKWMAAYTKDGYPQCSWNGNKHGRVQRIVYALIFGDLPDDMRIMTTCDHRWCVRQSHLKMVTQEDVLVKKWNRSATGDRNGSRTHPEKCSFITHPERRFQGHPPRETYARGESNGSSKLTETSVRLIRKLNDEGVSKTELATLFKVSRRAIYFIVSKETWSHVQ